MQGMGGRLSYSIGRGRRVIQSLRRVFSSKGRRKGDRDRVVGRLKGPRTCTRTLNYNERAVPLSKGQGITMIFLTINKLFYLCTLNRDLQFQVPGGTVNNKSTVAVVILRGSSPMGDDRVFKKLTIVYVITLIFLLQGGGGWKRRCWRVVRRVGGGLTMVIIFFTIFVKVIAV